MPVWSKRLAPVKVLPAAPLSAPVVVRSKIEPVELDPTNDVAPVPAIYRFPEAFAFKVLEVTFSRLDVPTPTSPAVTLITTSSAAIVPVSVPVERTSN